MPGFSRFLLICFGLLATATIVVAIVSPPKPEPAAAPAAAAAPDRRPTAEQARLWREALRRAGWECPAVSRLVPSGETARGKTAKVLCGPADGSGAVLRDRIYNVTIRPNDVVEVTQGTLYD